MLKIVALLLVLTTVYANLTHWYMKFQRRIGVMAHRPAHFEESSCDL